MRYRLPPLLLPLLLLVACVGRDAPPAPAVTIMTFNVENLFDTQHDEGKDDYTYLPLRAKDNAAHRARCARIERERWRRQCWVDQAATAARLCLGTIGTEPEDRPAPPKSPAARREGLLGFVTS